MPMLSMSAVQKAERLIQERARIASAKWNAVVDDPNLRPDRLWGGRVAAHDQEAADEELQWAIEEFRKRRLAEIDAQLRELGVDPTAKDDVEA